MRVSEMLLEELPAPGQFGDNLCTISILAGTAITVLSHDITPQPFIFILELKKYISGDQ
jgi:hypothetical protein